VIYVVTVDENEIALILEGPEGVDIQELADEYHAMLFALPGVDKYGNVSFARYKELKDLVPFVVRPPHSVTCMRYASICRYTDAYYQAIVGWLVRHHGFTKPPSQELYVRF